jgi:ribulose-phosphate 3-epimerase
MKISASIYSRASRPLDEVVHELDQLGIDFLHVDCNDDPRVFDDVARIRNMSRTPIDVHVISPDPEKYFPLIEANRVESAAFQVENFRGPVKLPAGNGQVGLALVVDTPITAFKPYEDACSFILIMTTTPGKSGGAFSPKAFAMIRQFQRRYPSKRVHVDGGVTSDVSFILRNMGVYCAVSGSYLLRAESAPTALMRLRSRVDSRVERSDFKVSDFMLRRNELPILSLAKAKNPRDILSTIDGHRLGFCLITGDQHRLEGVVTDGDIRRAVLLRLDQLGALTSKDLINTNPIAVSPQATLKEMLEIVTQHARPIVFVPVVDEHRSLVGAISFASLVRGEQ